MTDALSSGRPQSSSSGTDEGLLGCPCSRAFVFVCTTVSVRYPISTLAGNQQQRMLVAFLSCSLRSDVGLMFPVESMPALIRLCAYLYPPEYFGLC